MQYMYFIVHNIVHNIDSKIDVEYCMQYSVLLLLAIFVKDIVHIVHIVHIANASKILLLLSSIASNLVQYHEICCFIDPKLL